MQLARSAQPITPLPRPGLRALRWLALAALIMVVAVLVIGPRDDLTSALGQPVFLGSLAALLLTLAGGAFAAFALSVPGAERSRAQRVLPLMTTAAWSAIWLVAWSTSGGSAGSGTAAIHAMCAIQITVCALVTGSILFAMIARAAPLQRFWTAGIASLAAIATGAAMAQVLCPLDDPRHQLIGHVVIALLVAGTGLLAGRRTLGTC